MDYDPVNPLFLPYYIGSQVAFINRPGTWGQEIHLMRSRIWPVLVVTAFFALTLSAHANPIVTMTIVGVGGAHQHGVYVAPYYLTVDGGAPIAMACDDFTHEDHIPETYTAVVSTIADLSMTRFFASYGVDGYKEVFWLYDQYLQNPSQAGNINFAIWAIFDPAIIGNPSYWDANEQAWLNAANNALTSGALNSYDFSAFVVYTPIDPTTPQEMITKTPEPASMVLFGSGLMTLAGVIRRRRKA